MDTLKLPTSAQIFQILAFRARLTPPVAAETAHEFQQALYSCGFVQPYNWPDRQRWAEKLVDSPSAIKRCNLAEIVQLLTLHTRKDRFCEGHFDWFLGSGHAKALVAQLFNVVESGPPLGSRTSAKFDEFTRVVHAALKDRWDTPGISLYSPPASLLPGPLLLLGTNPGGAPDQWYHTVRENLDFRRRNTTRHAFVEPVSGKLDRLGRQLNWCVECLGVKMQDVPTINLTFWPTTSASGTEYPSDAHLCWPVHEWLIRNIRPRMLLVFGTSGRSPFAYIRNHVLPKKPATRDALTGHGNTRIRSFECALAGVDLTVVGIPHPSRFQLENEKLVRRELAAISRRSGLH